GTALAPWPALMPESAWTLLLLLMPPLHPVGGKGIGEREGVKWGGKGVKRGKGREGRDVRTQSSRRLNTQHHSSHHAAQHVRPPGPTLGVAHPSEVQQWSLIHPLHQLVHIAAITFEAPQKPGVAFTHVCCHATRPSHPRHPIPHACSSLPTSCSCSPFSRSSSPRPHALSAASAPVVPPKRVSRHIPSQVLLQSVSQLVRSYWLLLLLLLLPPIICSYMQRPAFPFRRPTLPPQHQLPMRAARHVPALVLPPMRVRKI
ncbi:unnamed protein product, partial [Closterium sp. NIES-54]